MFTLEKSLHIGAYNIIYYTYTFIPTTFFADNGRVIQFKKIDYWQPKILATWKIRVTYYQTIRVL